MELIVINGYLYKCKNGTNERIKKLCDEIHRKPASMHEHGTAGDEYNKLLEEIVGSTTAKFIENVYQYY